MIHANFRFTLAPCALLMAALFATHSAATLALTSDKNETIRGSADSLIVDQKNGIATYTGAVKIQQGSLMITADSIVIHTNPDSSVEKMIATGSPARFQQQPAEDQGVVTAAAKNITYTPSNEHLLLVEDASVEQNGAVMSGPHIDYDLVKEVMKAAGSNDASGDGQRIEIVIPPRAGNDGTGDTPPVPAEPDTTQSSSTQATQ
jgi:lipopolysaccharide export system protein LptA